MHLKPKSPLKNYEPRNGQIEEYLPEHDPDVDLVDADIPTEIKAPGRLRSAPRPDDVQDAVYTPALTAEGLEEVGGVADWWEDDKHWSPSLEYVGFGPREKITDPAVLEVLTRRAVVEALAVREVEGDEALGASWQAGGQEALLKALSIKPVVGENGAVKLDGDITSVVEDLKSQPVAEGLEQQSQEDFALPAEQAIEFRKSWDKSWKTISLDDPRLKFTVNKRVQQLTGHIIADHKLLTVRTVAAYLSILVKPPPAKKLAEVIEQKGELVSLPNVTVYTRRVTPIDKEKMVGRWKVIVNELDKRELPIVGTGGYSKESERKWAMGKV